MNPNVHDWTLVSIVMTWNVGEIEFVFKDQKSHIVKGYIYDFTELKIPKLQPWGKSVSINSLEITPEGNNDKKIRLEMQSGDVIEVTAKNIEINIP
ncbi:MAG: hypothetical protein Q8Q45_00120 [Methylococcaceae bacterium]|nr:hypothetical protein [Methylococcaceae bacterium]MDP2392733.1 hypothetical protein [Methylococcaceae bacterium]MDP3390417.1 hypothetical protein [Methylococcaceae bacterium]MDP3930733.1 hypothetical protein [Methylococcaceae bacterium]MDZ4157713.1 hypothetical protein [Methylococcales bacterium]